MRDAEATALLACPRCGGPLEPDGEGLACEPCARRWPRTDGVHRLLETEQGRSHAARTFGSQWAMRARGGFERETLYGFTRDEHVARFLRGSGLREQELAGKTILDAGCGTGLLAAELAARGARVVGVDLAAEMGRDAPRPLPPGLVLVQGDVLRLPVRSGVFDHVWCTGVIHTTPDPPRGFAELARATKPGGSLYVWVDNEDPNPIQRLHEALPRLPPRLLMALSFALALPAAAFVNLSRSPRYRRPMSVRTAAFVIHDHLAAPRASRHALGELEAWCAAAGLEPPRDVSEDTGGLAVRTRAPLRADPDAP